MRASVCPSDVLEKARLTFSRRAQRGSCSPDREREGSVCELRVSLVYFRRYRQRRAPRSEDTLSHTCTHTQGPSDTVHILYTFHVYIDETNEPCSLYIYANSYMYVCVFVSCSWTTASEETKTSEEAPTETAGVYLGGLIGIVSSMTAA